MKKRVLLVGPDFYNYNESVAKALEYNEYDVEILPYVEYLVKRIDRIKYYILPKLGINLFKQRYIEEFNALLLERYNEFRPDMVVVIKGNIITERTLRAMSNTIKIIWMMDSIFSVKNSISLLSRYEYRFMFEEADVEYLKEKGIESNFLPVGYDDSVYYSTNEKEKEIDIVFIGSLYDGRRELFETIVRDFSHLKIRVYGKYLDIKTPITFYNYFIKRYNKFFMNRNIDPKDTNGIYNKSKIAINIHHKQSVKSCNPRFFEILASGTFQLVDNKSYIIENFNKDYDIITFESNPELKEKIIKYLDDPKERQLVSKRGQEKVQDKHSFKKRIELMLDVVNNH